METWVFDRSGPYSGVTFDIHKEPEEFIQVLCAYLMMGDEELGLDTFTKAKDNKLFVTIPVEARGRKRKQQLELNPNPIAHQRAIVCRGTSCFLAKITGASEFDRVSQPPISRSFSQFHGLSIASNGQSKRKSTDRSSHSSKRSRSDSQLAETPQAENGVTYPVQEPQGTSLVQHDQTPYNNRILRILAISPPGQPISQFKSVIELLESLRDAIKAHRSLYMDGKILHRDISENNIIITDPKKANGFKGMLIDLELGKEEGKGPSGARQRTGTMEFMAIEVLLGISHTYRHDIEAFFYVLLWLCIRRGWALADTSKKRAPKTILSHWYTGTYKDIARNKRGDMDKNGLEAILRECSQVFDCVKPLCRAIRDVLFPHRDGPFTGTPQDPNILYDPIIKAFDDTIGGIRLDEEKT